MELTFNTKYNAHELRSRRNGALLTMIDRDRNLLIRDGIRVEMEAAKLD
jgi:hypothetical protein